MSKELMYQKQIEGVEGALPSRLGSVFAAVFTCTLVALLLGANALLNWTNNLPIGPASDFALQLATDWQGWMNAIGLGHFSTALNAWLTGFQSRHW
jgi:hypothetical protein